MVACKLPDVTEEDVEVLRRFVADAVEAAGSDGVVIGISGGLDSAVATKLCVDALGPGKVLNVFMPTGVSSEEDAAVTRELCSGWGTEYSVLDIQPSVDSMMAAVLSDDPTPLEKGNMASRCRMAVLYYLAKKRNRVVLGTCNRSEIMMGYFTKFGDGACDMTPLANLYKTEVRQVACIIGVPQEIIDKPPSAGLWEGQTDESEMGIRYCDLDAVLFGMEQGLEDGPISDATGMDPARVAEIRRKVKSVEHKRVLPGRPSNFRDFRS